jgi:hypothetical protein
VVFNVAEWQTDEVQYEYLVLKFEGMNKIETRNNSAYRHWRQEPQTRLNKLLRILH